jgi:hypothetical protein
MLSLREAVVVIDGMESFRTNVEIEIPQLPARSANRFHWTMLDIPATMTKLLAGMTDAPAGTMHGRAEHPRRDAAVHGSAHAGGTELSLPSPSLRARHEAAKSMQGCDAMLAAMKAMSSRAARSPASALRREVVEGRSSKLVTWLGWRSRNPILSVRYSNAA